MSETSMEREAEIDEVFVGTLPLIQMALVHYRLTSNQRKALESGLQLWFRRLVLRTANERTPVTAFRSYLLLATCQFAYSFQSRRGAASEDPRLADVLARNPRAVAMELQKMLESESARSGSSGRAVG